MAKQTQENYSELTVLFNNSNSSVTVKNKNVLECHVVL